MRQSLRSHLTYANVISTLCLFLLLGGGTAIALDGSNTVFSDDIVNNAVRSADVRDDTLSDGGLTYADLGPDSVYASEIGTGSVGSIEVSDDNLEATDLAPNSVGANEIQTGAVTSFEIGLDAVNSGEISAAAVGSSEIATNGVGGDEIADGAIGAAEIGEDAIHSHVGAPVAVPGGTAHNGSYDTQQAVAGCGSGEELLSGSAEWTDGLPLDQELWIQYIFLDHNQEKVYVVGGNDSGTTRDLYAVATCLAL